MGRGSMSAVARTAVRGVTAKTNVERAIQRRIRNGTMTPRESNRLWGISNAVSTRYQPALNKIRTPSGARAAEREVMRRYNAGKR